jgi:hypothetical protein
VKACLQCGQLDTHDATFCSACGARFDSPDPSLVPVHPPTQDDEISLSEETAGVADEQGLALVNLGGSSTEEEELSSAQELATEGVEDAHELIFDSDPRGGSSASLVEPVDESPGVTSDPAIEPEPLDLRARFPEKSTEHDHIEFLLKEISGWNQVSPALRRELRQPYENRLKVLKLDLGLQGIQPPVVESAQQVRERFVTPKPEVAAVNELASIQPPVVEIRNAPPGVGGPPKPLPANLNEARRERLARMSAPSEETALQDAQAAQAAPSQRQLDRQRLAQQQWEEFVTTAPVAPAEPPPPSGPSQAEVLMADVNRLLQEQNIKGLHLLGGLLVAVSFFGFLGANWDGYGKTVAALTMTLSPVFFFLMAGWLRDKLPQGSRLMSVIGGILLPIGLITFNQFHILGMNLPGVVWTPLSFLASSLVLLTLAKRFQEPACLYLGALVGFLCGLTSSSGLLLSFGSFGSAGLCLWLAHQELGREKDRPAESTEIAWSEHFKKLSTGLSSAGLLGGLVHTTVSVQSASTIFLVGSAYFTAQGYLSRSGNALMISALTGLMGAWGCQHLFKFSGPMMGLVSLVQGTMYLNRGRQLSKSEDPVEQTLGALSYSLGVFLTGFVLLVSFGWTIFEGAVDHFASFSVAEKLTSVGTGILATLYYSGAAYFYRRPQLVYAAAASCTYAYLMVVLLARQLSPEHYRILFILLPLAWQGLSVSLRSFIPRAYLTPWVLTGTALVALLGPLQVLGQMAKPNPWDLWVDLALALVFTCGAVWTQRRELLAPAVTSLLMAYNTCVPLVSHAVGITNLGLCYLPFIGILAASSAFLSRFKPDLGRAVPGATEDGEAQPAESFQFDFARPLLHWAFGLALIACLSQSYYYVYSSAQAAITLGLYGLGFLAASVVFKKSDFLGTANWEVFLSLALLNGLTSVAAYFQFKETGLLIDTGLCFLLAAVGSRMYSRVKSLSFSGLVWAVVPVFHGLVLAGLNGSLPLSLQLAAFVWTLPALLKPRVAISRESTPSPTEMAWATMAAALAGGASLMIYQAGLVANGAGLIQLLVMMCLQLFLCSWQDMGPLLAVSMLLNVCCILESTDATHDQVRALSWLVSTGVYATWGLRYAQRLPLANAWFHNCGAIYLCVSALSLLAGGVWCNSLLLADALGLIAWSTAKGRVQDHQAGSLLLFLALSALGYNLHWTATIYAYVMSAVGFAYLAISTRGLVTSFSYAQLGLIFTGVGYCTALMTSFYQGELLCTLLLMVDSLAVLGWAMLRGGPREHVGGSILLLVGLIALGFNLHWELFVYAYVLSAVGFFYLLVSSRFSRLGQSFVNMGIMFAGLGYSVGLVSAVSHGDPRSNALLLLDGLLVVGWSAWRGRVSDHIGGTMLLLLATTVLGYNMNWDSWMFSLVNSAIAVSYLLISVLVSQTRMSFRQMSILFAAIGYGSGLISEQYLPCMLLGGFYWLARTWITSKPSASADPDSELSAGGKFLGTAPVASTNLHFAFLCGYTIWCRCGLAPDTIESYTMPIGFWLFAFFEFRKKTIDPAVALLIVPSTIASLIPGSGHAFYALAISLVVLAFGAIRSRQRCITGGGAGLLAQVVIQAVFVAQQVPWYFSAVAVGLIVIAIALYLEKKKASRIQAIDSSEPNP